MPKSILEINDQQLAQVDYVLTDVDDTLTWQGALPFESIQALTLLSQLGVKVVAVTGACAGWCDQMAKLWPVYAVIGENGAFWMQKNQQGFQVQTWDSFSTMQARQTQLKQKLDALLLDYPEITYASDQAFRYADVAINIAQDRPKLDASICAALLASIQQMTVDGKRVHATQSSVHINAWVGEYNKKTSAQAFVKQDSGAGQSDGENCLYIGDSANDVSMFEWLALSVGVSNIRSVLSQLTTP
ncbi:MAG: HAD-IIB family hydrolase, partial [Vibrio sp.]